MATAPVFRATSGLNNVLEPQRLMYGDDGGCPLAEAVNVIIDDGGGIRRRLGIVQKVEGAAHSLWAYGPFCFFVSAGKLYRYTSSESAVLVHSSCGDGAMYFEYFGGKVYCSNGLFRAVITDDTISSWVASVPQQYRSDSRVLGLPSAFTKILRHAGRMYFVDGRYLWESEPFNPGCVDLANGFIDFGSSIIELVSVRSGIFVSTENKTQFLLGTNKDDYVLTDAYPFPIVPGTVSYVTADDVGNGEITQGISAIWVSQSGVCLGMEDGRVMNMTSRRLAFNSATGGTGVTLTGQYFFSLEV